MTTTTPSSCASAFPTHTVRNTDRRVSFAGAGSIDDGTRSITASFSPSSSASSMDLETGGSLDDDALSSEGSNGEEHPDGFDAEADCSTRSMSTSDGHPMATADDDEDGGRRRGLAGLYHSWLPCLRILALGGLLAGTVVLGKRVRFLAGERQRAYTNEKFFERSNEILRAARYRHQATLEALQTMGKTAAALAGERGEWPFVTLGGGMDAWTNRYALGAPSVSLVVLVEQDQRDAWGNYSRTHAHEWTQREEAALDDDDEGFLPFVWKTSDPNRTIDEAVRDGARAADPFVGTAAVSWQSTPPEISRINYNHLGDPVLARAFRRMQRTGAPTQALNTLRDLEAMTLLQPIVANKGDDDEATLVAFLLARVAWPTFFRELDEVPDEPRDGLDLYVVNRCGDYAFRLDLGYARRHRWVVEDPSFSGEPDDDENDRVLEAPFHPSYNGEDDDCGSFLRIRANEDFRAIPDDDSPLGSPSLAISVAFLVVALGSTYFVLHHFLERRRHAELAQSARKSLAIVNALFPATVRDRLLAKTEPPPQQKTKKKKDQTFQNRLSTVLQSVAENAFGSESERTPGVLGSPHHHHHHHQHGPTTTPWSIHRAVAHKPIADLFPQVTILFADIVGFTAWSSVREPSQVFTLLESIFEAFDAIAKRSRVFKVETIGDCYVAASGLPEPQPDHALVMARFSRRILGRMRGVVRSLETYLGPGTADLRMRVGLHSGPVMAGVLRGEKTRFQLFGDSMNTASRIEATGIRDRIHLSQQTAELLIAAGKSEWVEPRDEVVTAKGKGELQTYWLKQPEKAATMAPSNGEEHPSAAVPRETAPTSDSSAPKRAMLHLKPDRVERLERLVDFNTQVLEGLLKKMIAMRPTNIEPKSTETKIVPHQPSIIPAGMSPVTSILEEVTETIELPIEPAKYVQNPDSVTLPLPVKNQLRDYVSTIASMYRHIPFHSFDHASHVVMSVMKLLSRVVTPDKIDYRDMRYKAKAGGSSALHEYTFGITSDPLTQFAVAFSALVHDVDHAGVPNAQLVEEGDHLAKTYKEKSVAEQHSIQLAWDLLMEPSYADLRKCIYTSQVESDRFRALLVNVVMATDIADQSLGALRRRRWEKVFSNAEVNELDPNSTNRKATIVIEHLIQASDVAHTMQHWHVFLRWNQRLFEECYLAFQLGRAMKDPSQGWYQSELGFFDHYIIPLAKKLKECWVFGVASDEYLDYATTNRQEWEAKGRGIVEGYLDEFWRKAEKGEFGDLPAAKDQHNF